MKQFQKVLVKKPNRALHDLSHEKKLTCKMGQLVPVLAEEVLPGDSFRISTEVFTRFFPLIAPIMHRVNIYLHGFFVPWRLVWEDWEEFITQGVDGNSSVTLPVFTGNTDDFYAETYWSSPGSLADHLGIPVQMLTNDPGDHVDISQLPFRVYQKIWTEYYRDQTLYALPSGIDVIDSVDIDISAGTPAIIKIKTRAWEKDYFTSSLPFTQRGTEVTLPLGTTAPVEGYGDVKFIDNTGTVVTPATPKGVFVHTDGQITQDGTSPTPGNSFGFTGLEADLSSATAATINDLRAAFALQRWFEKNARGGARYIENTLVHFGVKSKDERLQRPEYIGGGKMPVVVSEVLQTSQTDVTPQGTQAGRAGSAGSFNMSYNATEHGMLMIIMSILPKSGYFQGIPRFFLKSDFSEFFWPDFAHLGEQEVYDAEIYNESGITKSDVFGYQERYAEYRYHYDTAAGYMRDSLDHWHLLRKFSTAPGLNAAFSVAAADDRIFPAEDCDQVMSQIYFDIKAIRPVPKFGTPI